MKRNLDTRWQRVAMTLSADSAETLLTAFRVVEIADGTGVAGEFLSMAIEARCEIDEIDESGEAI